MSFNPRMKRIISGMIVIRLCNSSGLIRIKQVFRLCRKAPHLTSPSRRKQDPSINSFIGYCHQNNNIQDQRDMRHFLLRPAEKTRFIDFFNDLNNSVLGSDVEIEEWDLDLANTIA